MATVVRLVAGSPEWWRERLIRALRRRREQFDDARRYYDGAHAPVFDRGKVDPRLADVFELLRVNLCELAVDLLAERLNVEGFRFGQGMEADAAAWDVWQANALDLASADLHVETIRSGWAAVIVWADADGDPQISCEDPEQVIVERSAVGRRERLAALKLFTDDLGDQVAEVYLPDGLFRWRKQRGVWVDAGAVPNPLGVVPVVEFANRGRAGGPEVTGSLITLQDMVNRALANMLVAGDVGVFAQKWATGIEIPVDPVTGKPVEPFRAAVDRLWVSENPAASFGAFPTTPLDPYATEIGLAVKLFASLSRIPAHYLLNMEGQWPTGDSLRAAETGLVSKVRSKQRRFGEAWEDVMRLAFLVQGDVERARAFRAETLWSDPETRTESERADALVKLAQIGVPYRQLWLRAGFTESDADQFDAWWQSIRRTGSAVPIAGQAAVTATTGVAPSRPVTG